MEEVERQVKGSMAIPMEQEILTVEIRRGC
jgi:hypothetical protein